MLGIVCSPMLDFSEFEMYSLTNNVPSIVLRLVYFPTFAPSIFNLAKTTRLNIEE